MVHLLTAAFVVTLLAALAAVAGMPTP